MSLAFNVKLSGEAKRRIILARKAAGDEPLSETELRDLLAETETADDDAFYRAYCHAIGDALVEVPPAEWERIQDGIAKGEQVEREFQAERAQETRELAEQERRELQEVERLWPTYAAMLGIEP